MNKNHKRETVVNKAHHSKANSNIDKIPFKKLLLKTPDKTKLVKLFKQSNLRFRRATQNEIKEDIEDEMIKLKKDFNFGKNEPEYKKLKEENQRFLTEYRNAKKFEKASKGDKNTFKDLVSQYKQKGYKIPDLSTKHNLFKICPLIEESCDKMAVGFNNTNKISTNQMEDKTMYYLKKLNDMVSEQIYNNLDQNANIKEERNGDNIKNNNCQTKKEEIKINITEPSTQKFYEDNNEELKIKISKLVYLIQNNILEKMDKQDTLDNQAAKDKQQDYFSSSVQKKSPQLSTMTTPKISHQVTMGGKCPHLHESNKSNEFFNSKYYSNTCEPKNKMKNVRKSIMTNNEYFGDTIYQTSTMRYDSTNHSLMNGNSSSKSPTGTRKNLKAFMGHNSILNNSNSKHHHHNNFNYNNYNNYVLTESKIKIKNYKDLPRMSFTVGRHLPRLSLPNPICKKVKFDGLKNLNYFNGFVINIENKFDNEGELIEYAYSKYLEGEYKVVENCLKALLKKFREMEEDKIDEYLNKLEHQTGNENIINEITNTKQIIKKADILRKNRIINLISNTKDKINNNNMRQMVKSDDIINNMDRKFLSSLIPK